MFKRAEAEARKEFALKENIELGNIVAVSQQVVAGMNFKMTFNTAAGNYAVTVFAQPWTDTYKVTHIEKVSKPAGN